MALLWGFTLPRGVKDPGTSWGIHDQLLCAEDMSSKRCSFPNHPLASVMLTDIYIYIDTLSLLQGPKLVNFSAF